MDFIDKYVRAQAYVDIACIIGAVVLVTLLYMGIAGERLGEWLSRRSRRRAERKWQRLVEQIEREER